MALFGCSGDPSGGDDDSASGATSEAASTGAATGDQLTTGPATGDDATGDETTDATTDPTAVPDGYCEPEPVACEDAAIQDLSLQKTVSDGTVQATRDGADWLAKVDARAGGAMNAPMNAWLYMRFTDAGLVKVEIDDLAALTSSAWDIAAKRYGIRVNSGSSGPSCVHVAPGGSDYAALAAVPADAAFAPENYYGGDCSLITNDDSLGDPAYQLTGWWTYAGCVQTTGAPFVLRLADDRVLKLVVDAYYEQGQAACNETNAMGTGAAQMTWRFQYLP